MARAEYALHDFVSGHLPELADLWVDSWRAAMPAIDFEARRVWFIDHLSALQANGAQMICAFDRGSGSMAGFVTIDPLTGHLDQLAVAPRFWGHAAADALLDEAQRRSPDKIWLEVNQDNERAMSFYERRGFVREGESVNPRSGRKTWGYRWPANPQPAKERG